MQMPVYIVKICLMESVVNLDIVVFVLHCLILSYFDVRERLQEPAVKARKAPKQADGKRKTIC